MLRPVILKVEIVHSIAWADWVTFGLFVMELFSADLNLRRSRYSANA